MYEPQTEDESDSSEFDSEDEELEGNVPSPLLLCIKNFTQVF